MKLKCYSHPSVLHREDTAFKNREKLDVKK